MAETKHQLLCNKIDKAITHQISFDKMQQFMISKHKIPSSEAFCNIDWDNISNAIISTKQGRRRWIAKHHVYGTIGTPMNAQYVANQRMLIMYNFVNTRMLCLFGRTSSTTLRYGLLEAT
jgi:hypothetical protein